MKDISLHILDIAENSINAEAKNIEIKIIEDSENDLLTLEITDDGKGIKNEMKEKITDPFVTSRTTRKVGLGLPLLKAAAESANGKLIVESNLGKGTKLTATFQLSHIDRKPLGNIADTIVTLAAGNPEVNIKYLHKHNNSKYSFDAREFRKKYKDFSKQILEMKKSLNKYYNI